MKPIRKMALVVMTLSIAAAAGQVVQGNASHVATDIARKGAGTGVTQARVEPGMFPQLPASEARLPARKITLVSFVPAEGRAPAPHQR